MSRKRIGKKKHNISGVSKNLTCAPNQSLAIPAHGEDTLTSKIVFWSQSCALWTCYLCPAGTTAPAKMWLLQKTKNVQWKPHGLRWPYPKEQKGNTAICILQMRNWNTEKLRAEALEGEAARWCCYRADHSSCMTKLSFFRKLSNVFCNTFSWDIIPHLSDISPRQMSPYLTS